MEILAGTLILIGLAGSVLPFLPGPPLSYVGLFIYAYKTGFSEINTTPLLVFGLLTLFTILVDYFAPALGAKTQKASKAGVTGAIVGSFLGIFVAGPFGLLLGPLVGSFIGEYIVKRDFNAALKIGWGSFLGFIVGTVFRLLVALSITVYFFYILLG